jgi:hypothetical protein
VSYTGSAHHRVQNGPHHQRMGAILDHHLRTGSPQPITQRAQTLSPLFQPRALSAMHPTLATCPTCQYGQIPKCPVAQNARPSGPQLAIKHPPAVSVSPYRSEPPLAPSISGSRTGLLSRVLLCAGGAGAPRPSPLIRSVQSMQAQTRLATRGNAVFAARHSGCLGHPCFRRQGVGGSTEG